MVNKLVKCFILISLMFSVNVFAEEKLQDNQENNLQNIELTQENESLINDINNSQYKVIIEDDANLLTEQEETLLYDEMTSLTKYGHILFKTVNTNTSSTSSYASNYYHSKVGTESGTLFIIDMDNREIYIFSDGNNYNIITTSKANIITDNIYRYASNGNYYECSSEAYKQILALLEGQKIAEPMRYISNGVLAITIASFINFFIVMYKSRIKKSNDSEILKNCDIDFKVDNIKGVKTGTRSVYSPVSDSSSSDGSSGGGGGGSSGGGGGHGF